MNFTEIVEELLARGTDYLNEDATQRARAERWVNQAYREILNLHVWPFNKNTATGVAGSGTVSIPDIRKIILVTNSDTGAPLARTSQEDLVHDGADVTTTGTPESYWLDGTTVKAYPVGGTLVVTYAPRVAPMSGTDTPIFDEEYHNLIVDRAMMKAYIDSDNFEAAAALRQEFDAGVTAMAEDYQVYSRDLTYIHVVDPIDG